MLHHSIIRSTVAAILVSAMVWQISSNATAATFEEIQAQVAQMQAAGAPRESTQDLVEQWIGETGIVQLDAEQAHWCLPQILPQKAERNAFTATWTGQVNPPRAGRFIFSVSPININKAGSPNETVQHSMKVFVDGQQVVDANPKEWKSQGTPIQLDAGTPVSLRVELTYSSTDGTYGDSPHALLYWEGPGISRQIVPTEVLAPSQGQGTGLSAEYRWNEGEQQRVAVQQDPNIEFAWATCRDVAPRNPELVASLTQRLWQLATDSVYLTSTLADPPPAKGHVYFRNYTSTQFLSCAQQLQFLQIVLQNPRLLERADQTQILRLYHSLRFGEEDAALDVLGTWMQQRGDLTPVLADDFFDSNRRFFRTVALYLVFRTSDTEIHGRFQERYLEMPDGRCCLPAAYSLAYSNVLNGTPKEWVDVLDAKLAEPELAGERRVNWLIARAMADEIGKGSGRILRGENIRREINRFTIAYENVGAGREWLDEAVLVAELPGTKTRIAKERVCRLTAMHNWAAAKAELQKAPAELADWGQQVDALQTQAIARAAQEEKSSQAAFLAELERRLAMAQQRQDQVEVEHYQQFIDIANQNVKE